MVAGQHRAFSLFPQHSASNFKTTSTVFFFMKNHWSGSTAVFIQVKEMFFRENEIEERHSVDFQAKS